MTEIIQRKEGGWKLDNSYARLPHNLFAPVSPTPVHNPELVILNEKLALELELSVPELESNMGLEILAGNKVPEGSMPLAQAYAGHQFGYFTMLGDGRALLLGEQVTSNGKRVDIQLKGSGRTPYSRGGDGRAALGPMLREYIISEAMYALGIPTTRSLAVVTTGESVMRETQLTGAILTRIASSHMRIATFQYAAHFGTLAELRALADYSIQRHFPDGKEASNSYLFLLQKVVQQQAVLIAKWQLVGFIHGVMNTDNMTISGETIDYGPCAFMDAYDPKTVFSSIDTGGRYAYGNQAEIATWNLARFAETLLPLLHDNQKKAIELAEQAISDFQKLYERYWLSGMRAKLGIFNEEMEDEALIQDLLQMMHKYNADYTNTFLVLTFDQYSNLALWDSKEFVSWKMRWELRLGRQQQSREESQELMRNSNPAIIPRNHRVEEALEAAVGQGDYSVMKRLLHALSNPYAHSEEQVAYARLPEKVDPSYRTYCGT